MLWLFRADRTLSYMNQNRKLTSQSTSRIRNSDLIMPLMRQRITLWYTGRLLFFSHILWYFTQLLWGHNIMTIKCIYMWLQCSLWFVHYMWPLLQDIVACLLYQTYMYMWCVIYLHQERWKDTDSLLLEYWFRSKKSHAILMDKMRYNEFAFFGAQGSIWSCYICTCAGFQTDCCLW